ncbi:Uncharacterised protein [Yersinia intermedia]|nr:Uncharacterised protein [Yersinia intermedia]
MDDFSADDFQSLCVKINSVLKEQNTIQHPMSDFKQQADPQEVQPAIRGVIRPGWQMIILLPAAIFLGLHSVAPQSHDSIWLWPPRCKCSKSMLWR